MRRSVGDVVAEVVVTIIAIIMAIMLLLMSLASAGIEKLRRLHSGKDAEII